MGRHHLVVRVVGGSSGQPVDHVSVLEPDHGVSRRPLLRHLTGRFVRPLVPQRSNGTSWRILPGATRPGLEAHAGECLVPDEHHVLRGRLVRRESRDHDRAVERDHVVDRPQSKFAGLRQRTLRTPCPSDSSCFAVGVSRDSPLVERWDGSSWSMAANVPLPPDRDRQLLRDLVRLRHELPGGRRSVSELGERPVGRAVGRNRLVDRCRSENHAHQCLVLEQHGLLRRWRRLQPGARMERHQVVGRGHRPRQQPPRRFVFERHVLRRRRRR